MSETCSHGDKVIIHLDGRGSPSEDVEYQPAGMEALEILHSQLQLLVSKATPTH